MNTRVPKQIEFSDPHIARGQKRYCHGGELRKRSSGRHQRPLHLKKPIHLVLKCNRSHTKSLRLPQHFAVCKQVVQTYAKRFFIKIEQMTIQTDHIHFIVRIHRRSHSHNFLRVVAGQIAQQLQNLGLAKVSIKENPNPTAPKNKRQHQNKRFWKWRPYTRLIIGYRAWKIVHAYLQLNELEAQGKLPYQKDRLRGIKQNQLRALWDG